MPEDFSHDSAFKTLIIDFPMDTVRWLFPDLETKFGEIQGVEFLREEMKKLCLKDAGRILDFPMKVYLKDAEFILLIEHKSEKQSFQITKVAHYALDLWELYPETPIIPVVIFADKTKWRKDVCLELESSFFGKNWLYFRYKKVKINEINVLTVVESENPVLHILTPLMNYKEEDRLHWVAHAYLRLRELLEEHLFKKYMDFIDKYADIKKSEKELLEKALASKKEGFMLREALFQDGFREGEVTGFRKGEVTGFRKGEAKGEAKGEIKSKILIAQKLIQEGFDDDFVFRMTNLHIEDVQRLLGKNFDQES